MKLSQYLLRRSKNKIKISDRLPGEQNLLGYLTRFLDTLASKSVIRTAEKRGKESPYLPNVFSCDSSRLQAVAVALGFHYSSTVGCKDHKQLAF